MNAAPAFGRRETILHTVRRSYQIAEKPPVIVEIGTSRDEQPEACNGDGWSTRAWGWYAQQTGGKAYTIDIAPEAIEASKRISSEFRDSINYLADDSLEYLRNWDAVKNGQIDLLYMDGLDYNEALEPEIASGAPGCRTGMRAQSEQFHLALAEVALPHLSDRCLVLIDDTYPADVYPYSQPPALSTQCCTGKGASAVPYLLQNGFSVEFITDGQALLSRGLEGVPPEIGIPNATSALAVERLRAYARRQWLEMPPLCVIAQGCRQFEATAEAQIYLDTVARLCGTRGTALEINPTSAFAQALLASRGIEAGGLLFEACVMARAQHAARWLGSRCGVHGRRPLYNIQGELTPARARCADSQAGKKARGPAQSWRGRWRKSKRSLCHPPQGPPILLAHPPRAGDTRAAGGDGCVGGRRCGEPFCAGES